MTAPTNSRRSFLAVVMAAIGSARPVAAAAPQPDRELLALGRKVDDLAPRNEVALRAYEDLQDEFVPPPPPATLNATRRDFFLVGAFDTQPGVARYWSERTIQRLRTERFVKHLIEGATFNEDGTLSPRVVPDEQAHARAAEIVAAYDRWRAEIAEAERAFGLTAAKAESDRIAAEHLALRVLVAEAPATTLDGFVVKARSAFYCYGDIEDEDFGPHAQELATGLVRDLVRFADGQDGRR